MRKNETVEMKENQIIKRKSQYFFDNKLDCHIKLLSGKFINGMINTVKEDYFLITEKQRNIQRPVFFVEVEDISPYRIKEIEDKKEEKI